MSAPVERKVDPFPNRTPRWMVTFADLMSLLFALFVLMMSFSEIDSNSFRRNAGPISQAFNGKSTVDATSKMAIPITKTKPVVDTEEGAPDPLTEKWKRDLLYRLRAGLAAETQSNEVGIIEEPRQILLRFPSSSTFPTGDAALSDHMKEVVDRVGQVLADTSGDIIVSGHTDPTPVNSSQFRSNWDLSAARAVSVIHELTRNPYLDAARLSAQGLADTRPIASNNNPEGQSINRRVDISIRTPHQQGIMQGRF